MNTPDTNYLRLFPLGGVVLFPGMELPLHIFEERYQLLTKECLDENAPFGVLLLQSGREVNDMQARPFDVGTTAHIKRSEPLGGGRVSLLAVGGKRFRVHAFSYDQPYLTGEVMYFEDEQEEQVPSKLTKDLQTSIINYLYATAQLSGNQHEELLMPDDPVELSYFVAQAFQGNQKIQQLLLEAPTTSDRINLELLQIKEAQAKMVKLSGARNMQNWFSKN